MSTLNSTVISRIKIKQGETLRLSVLFKDPKYKKPLNMSSKYVNFSMKRRGGTLAQNIIIQPIVEETGIFEIYGDPTATGRLPVGIYECDVDVDDGVSIESSQTFLIEVTAAI
jgi:hypothetical protein